MNRFRLALSAAVALAALSSPLSAQPAPAAAAAKPGEAPASAQAAEGAHDSAQAAPATADDAWTESADGESLPAKDAGPPAPAQPRPAATPAQAAATGAPPVPLTASEEPEPPRTLGTHQRHIGLEVGLRTSFIHNSGFDPFAEQDTLAQFSAALGGALLTSDRSSLAVFLGYEAGGKEASARGERTELDLHRLLLAPELRRHLWPTFYVYARPAVGATHIRAALFDSSIGAWMVAKGWELAFDASGGGAFELFGRASGARTGVRAWVLAEGGYGVGSEFPLRMKPDGESLPARAAPIDLGALRLSGPFFRLMLALTY